MHAPENEKELEDWVHGKVTNLKRDYEPRNEVWRFDRAMLNQAYRQADPGFPLILSSEPRTQFQLALNIGTKIQPRFHVVIHDQPADEKDRMNDYEKFANGLWRAADKSHRRAGGHSLLRDIMYYSLQGGVTLFPFMTKGLNGETVPRIFVWDPVEVFPDFTELGLEFVARCYKTTPQSALSMAERNDWKTEPIERAKSAEHVEVVNVFWHDEDGVHNLVTVNNHTIKPDTVEGQFSYTPPIVVPANGQPFRDEYFQDYPAPRWAIYGHVDEIDWRARAWEGFLAPMRDVVRDFDSYLTLSAEILRRTAMPRFVENTRDGRPNSTPQQFRKAEKITMMPGETITPLQTPTSPREREELLNYFQGAIQRAGLSFTAFGQLGIEISGVTVDSLINATQSVMAPFIQTAEHGIAESILSLTDQFRKGKFKAIDLEVQGDSPVADRWFIKPFARKDIPKVAFLTAELGLALPDTRLARINAARAAVGDNRQLMSEEAIAETLLPDMVPDFKVDRDRRDEDMMHVSPQGQAIMIINGFRQIAQDAMARGDRELAMVSMNIIQGTLMQFQQQIAGAQQRTAGINAQRQAQAGASITEPSPDQSPPEASGVRPEAVDADRVAGNPASTLLAKRSNSVNGSR